MSLAKTHRSRWAFALVAVLLAAPPTLAGATPEATPARIPLDSDWIGSRDGWEWIADGGVVRASGDGGRSWEMIFRGGNYLFFHARTSRRAAAVSTGRVAGATYWTNDGGSNWFALDAIPLRAVVAGSGNGLYWHERGDAIYRVEGWPPRGDFACVETESDFGPPLPGHPLCRQVADGLRSVLVTRLAGSTFDQYGGMTSVPPARGAPGGVVELVDDLPNPRGGAVRGRGVVVVRGGGIAMARLLPRPGLRPGEETGGERLFVAWPRVYVVAPLMTESPVSGVGPSQSGAVLWRSRNGGDTWAIFVARSLPRRAAHVRGPARLGARVVLPGGWVAVGRAGPRPAVAIRQLGRTRPLLGLPGSKECGALRPIVDWPHVVVEGRRGTRLRAVWLSSDGGYRWTAFGRC